MARRKRKTAFGKKEQEVERGYRVVDLKGEPVYAPAHPEGIPLKEAERLADAVAIPARVVKL
jgi:hypothetical protein